MKTTTKVNLGDSDDDSQCHQAEVMASSVAKAAPVVGLNVVRTAAEAEAVDVVVEQETKAQHDLLGSTQKVI